MIRRVLARLRPQPEPSPIEAERERLAALEADNRALRQEQTRLGAALIGLLDRVERLEGEARDRRMATFIASTYSDGRRPVQ